MVADDIYFVKVAFQYILKTATVGQLMKLSWNMRNAGCDIPLSFKMIVRNDNLAFLLYDYTKMMILLSPLGKCYAFTSAL